MAAKKKANAEKGSNPNDYGIEIALDDSTPLLVVQNDETRKWRGEVYEQLVMWRGIPHPQQISYGDESVRKIAYARGVKNPLQPSGTKERELMERIRKGVIAQALQARQDLSSSVITLSLLKNAFIFDERMGTVKLRGDIAKLIGAEKIEESVELYFARQAEGKFQPVFPVLDRDVAAEMAMALSNAMVEEFPMISEKIREKLAQIDKEIDEQVVVVEAEAYDDAGFQP